MVTTTLRQTHGVDGDYSDLTLSIPGAAGATGFIKHLGGVNVEIVFGGSEQPESDVRGTILPAGGEEWGEASNIWVRCRHGGEATLGFNVVE